MNENAERWVEALRNGKYEQNKGCLRAGDKFCCLGVACDLYNREAEAAGIGRWETGPEFMMGYWTSGYGAFDDVLPAPVAMWLGLTSEFGKFYVGSDSRSLSDENDEGASFEEIADLIEKYKDQLFV